VRNAIRALAELAPRLARVRRNSQDIEVPVETVEVGDLVIVRPSERIPGSCAKSGAVTLNAAAMIPRRILLKLEGMTFSLLGGRADAPL
jgi:cation transport ATPase